MKKKFPALGTIAIFSLIVPSLGLLVSCSSSPSEATQPFINTSIPNDAPATETATPQLPLKGWIHWRGPEQMGSSPETQVPTDFSPNGPQHLWSIELFGGGTPVIANGRLFAFGYRGSGALLQETLSCIDVETGKYIWERRFTDFVSDIIYNRYAVGSPAVDPETGNIYLHTSPGLLLCFDWNGNLLWERSLGEEFGRLTFPNGRTGTPVIDEGRVIVHGITANWGRHGPAADRFYAFDKHTGTLMWSSQPGTRPTDSSFATPVFQTLTDGRRVFYAGTGCGHIVCVDSRTGLALWRHKMLIGGINSTIVLANKSTLIAIHGKENIDRSTIGRMIALKIPTTAPEAKDGPLILGTDSELWRNDDDLRSFTSSPVFGGGRIYQTVATGELKCIDPKSGKILWVVKLSPDQLHASPLYVDGKLLTPMHDGSFHVVDAKDGKILQSVELEGPALGAPAIADGRVFVHTKKKLYCFGPAQPTEEAPVWDKQEVPSAGELTTLKVVPSEFRMSANDEVQLNVVGLDDKGIQTGEVSPESWEAWIPATAKVKAKLDASITPEGKLTSTAESENSAGAFRATLGEKAGTTRGRILTDTYSENFESYQLTQKTPTGIDFAFPPLPWLGARVRWRVIEKDGSKVMTNTLERVLFQRTKSIIGHPEMSNYIMQADVMTDGNRRIKSDIGFIHQRYLISLGGNWQILEVSSNHERLKESVPFQVKPNTWYRLKTKVSILKDGNALIQAKAWNRDTEEPATWTIEVTAPNGHPKGAPGLYAFSPQSKKQVYIDNISITKANQ